MGGRYDAHVAGREAERSQAGLVATQAFAHGGVGGLEVVLVDALGVGARLAEVNVRHPVVEEEDLAVRKDQSIRSGTQTRDLSRKPVAITTARSPGETPSGYS